MNILIKNAKIISSDSPFNGKIKDIFIEKGIITKIENNINNISDILVEKENLHVSIGWIDFGVNVGFPKSSIETIETIVKASVKGGFTELGVYSSSNNIISDLQEVSYFKSLKSIINFYPIVSATKEMKGEELNESYILKNNGAISFCDNKREIKSNILEKIIFEYNNSIGIRTIVFPYNRNISNKGTINESNNSIFTGLKTTSYISETINLLRDIEISKYTNSKIHFQSISCSESLEIIEKARKNNDNITVHITPYHLILNDEEILNFNTNAKVLPPLRNKEDNIALREGLLNGNIDFISSDHTPIFLEDKNCEFDLAEYGTIGLESCFPAVYNFLENDINLEKLIDIFSLNPRKIFHLEIPKIEINCKANMTLFNPKKEWIFDINDIKSKQKNSIFLGKKMKGEIYGIINNEKIILN